MKGWHFLAKDRRLGYRDGRLVRVGKKITVDSSPVLCQSGLHASARIIDALEYSVGPIICRVEVGGKIIKGGDKFVGTERTVLWMADATEVLKEFARKCALDVVHLWGAPEVVINYLKTGDENLRDAARDAAGAARDAAGDAAWAAGAARDAAGAAAWAAARAAWAAGAAGAARAAWIMWVAEAAEAARNAAGAAAEKKQNRRLLSMIRSLK